VFDRITVGNIQLGNMLLHTGAGTCKVPAGTAALEYRLRYPAGTAALEYRLRYPAGTAALEYRLRYPVGTAALEYTIRYPGRPHS
jgi:hypothetical protein